MSRPLVFLALVVSAVTLASCGGTKSRSTTRAATTASPATVTVTKTTTTPAPAPKPAGAQLCRGGNLDLTVLGQQGAAGHGEVGFALRNTSSFTCHTGGFPGILWLARSESPLPTTPKHVTTDLAGSVPVVSLTVPPGGKVSFRVFVTHGAVPGSHCTTAYAFQVIPPNDTSTTDVTLGPEGVYECAVTTVSPLRPGTSAYP